MNEMGKELHASMGVGWLVENEGVRVTGAMGLLIIGIRLSNPC